MQQDVPQSVKIWIWIHVPMVLPNPWALLWISSYFRGWREKISFCIIVQVLQWNARPHILSFACQLSEYFLNKEPELFKNTKFWHDLFNFVGHVCGINFKSERVLGLEEVNTEIFEQVNSFLQCIKYTGSHLSQEYFTFFVQFFLYLINKEKMTAFCWQAAIAVAGQM